MPVFTIDTNVSKEKITDEFLKSTTNVVAKALGKPVSYVVVQVNPDQKMTFGGTSEPCANASLGSIGKIGKEENKKTSAALYKHIEETLGVQPDRMYITFKDLDKVNVGYRGSTFDDFM